MRKFLKIALLPALAVAMFAIVPALASAGAGLTPAFLPPTVDSGTCHSITNPTPAPGSSVQPAVPVIGSQIWHHPSGSEVGIKGSNGFLVVKDNPGAGTASVQGRLVPIDLRGQASVSPASSSVCLSQGTNRVRVAVP
jgi:hypothetical protein